MVCLCFVCPACKNFKIVFLALKANDDILMLIRAFENNHKTNEQRLDSNESQA